MPGKVTKESPVLSGVVDLPPSKSISNRVLVIKALCGWGFEIESLSNADDTRHLESGLSLESKHIFAGDGGTTLRFLAAVLATKPGEWTLSGSATLSERPINILVEALRALGAQIEYTSKSGFPPLKIRGQRLKGGEVTVPGDVSSQFISALLMVAPLMENGLRIRIRGPIVSRPYIQMTLKLMKYFGVDSRWDAYGISVKKQSYQPRDITIEPDWTAASYFYQMAALSEAGSLHLRGLKPSKLQGDTHVIEIMKSLAVETEFQKTGALIYSTAGPVAKDLQFDLTDHPDLTQTVAFTCAALGRLVSFEGIDHLRIKETDRLQAIQWELGKVGFGFDRLNGMWKTFKKENPVKLLQFNTYNDHRMAMSVAPLAIRFGTVTIDRPDVVNKSFPDYWNQLKRIGFKIEVR